MQPSTIAAAPSRLFVASTSTSPGVVDTRQRDDSPEAQARLGPLDRASEKQGHVSLVAEDAYFGRGEGGGEGEGGLLLDNVDSVRLDVGVSLRRRQAMASRSLAGGDAGADAGAGASAEVALIRRGDFNGLRGQCDDRNSFTVTSEALSAADGCYSAIVGTDFGEGSSYSTPTDEDGKKRSIYPKLITRDGESKVSALSLA